MTHAVIVYQIRARQDDTTRNGDSTAGTHQKVAIPDKTAYTPYTAEDHTTSYALGRREAIYRCAHAHGPCSMHAGHVHT
jgi:hypothetical protein